MRYIIIATLTFLFSCKAAENTSTSEESTKDTINNTNVVNVEFNVIKSGTNGGFTKKYNEVITSNEDFQKTWDRAFINMTEKSPLPEIDFENKMLILVTMGEQNSGGHKIEVSGVNVAPDGVGISILETKPGKKCMSTSAMTYPYQIVEISKSDKKVGFFTKEHFSACE